MVEGHGRAGGSIVGPISAYLDRWQRRRHRLRFVTLAHFSHWVCTPPSLHASHVRDLRSKGWNDRETPLTDIQIHAPGDTLCGTFPTVATSRSLNVCEGSPHDSGTLGSYPRMVRNYSHCDKGDGAAVVSDISQSALSYSTSCLLQTASQSKC